MCYVHIHVHVIFTIIFAFHDSNLFAFPQRLQAHALSRSQPIVPSHLPPHPPPNLHPSSPSNHHGNDPDSDIAGWIEERNILLQTGVYTHSDPTIQKLDKKIREALVAKSSSHEEQSSSY